MAQSYKSSIEFGLVYIPVTLHACVKHNDIGFNMLYKKTKERIKYHKTCPSCPHNLITSDIVKGFEYEPNKYVILTEKEIENIKSNKDKSISILEFVKLNEIDPMYYEKSYFVVPTGADKAFHLLLQALAAENKVGMAKTVLGTKEQIVAVRVLNGQMILSTLYFYDEIQKNPIKIKNLKMQNSELVLAKSLIKNMTNKFYPENYKNEYREKLMNAIEAKVRGEEIIQERTKLPHNVINLMDALKKSVKASTKSKKDNTSTKKLAK